MQETKKISSWVYFVAIAVFFVSAIAGYFVSTKYWFVNDTALNENKDTTLQEENSDMLTNENKDTDKQLPEYTMDEVAKHNKRDDCWFVIDGYVYDVTKFIASGKHPGGDAVVAGCGKDATELFNTRPMGSGTSHSDTARENAKKFIIGVLKNN